MKLREDLFQTVSMYQFKSLEERFECQNNQVLLKFDQLSSKLKNQGLSCSVVTYPEPVVRIKEDCCQSCEELKSRMRENEVKWSREVKEMRTLIDSIFKESSSKATEKEV